MRGEVKIVKVRAHGEIFKVPMRYSSGKPGFGICVVYTAEDSREFDSTVSTDRKKDVMNRVAREQQSAEAGAMEATIEDGRLVCTCTKWSIGLSGATGFAGKPILGLVPLSQRKEVVENVP